MLFEVIAVESAESAIDHILSDWFDWLACKYKWSPTWVGKKKPYMLALIRAPLELYMLHRHRASLVECLFGLQRRGGANDKYKVILGTAFILLQKYTNDYLAGKMARLLMFTGFASGWLEWHSLPFAVLGCKLEYREGASGNTKMVLSTVMYAIRLWHQNKTTIPEKTTKKPMPIRQSTGGCSKCGACDGDMFAHPSGMVYCAGCVGVGGAVVECAVTGLSCSSKHVRRLRL